MSDIKFSIITASLNSGKYIEDTIISVVNQTYKNKEHIIIDGGSKDSTLDILNSYSNSFSYFISEPDDGIADAMNKGIKKATGDYIIFINSDDYLLNESILEKISCLIKDRFDYYIFNVLSISKDNTKYILPAKKIGLSTYFKMGSCHQGHVISRELFEKYGMYDTTFKIGMDYEFILKIIDKDIQFKSMKLVISAMRHTGISSRKDWHGLMERFMDEKKAHEKNCNNIFMKSIYMLYWYFYVRYRKIRHYVSKCSIGPTFS